MNEEPLIVPVPQEQPAETAPPRRRGLKALGVVAVVGVAGAAIGAVLLGGLTGQAQPAGEVRLAAEPVAAEAAAHPAKGPKDKRRQQADTTVLLGTVKSVETSKLTVTRDGGGEVTVEADARTRVHGNGVAELTGLKPGNRVAVRVTKDNKALRVTVPKAHLTGTVTKLDGDRATILARSGLAQAVDLSGIQDKPKVGDVVAVRGDAVESGAVLKAERLRQVPAKR
ncbi:hypothetical protein [Crossiella sp. NPDC003009]